MKRALLITAVILPSACRKDAIETRRVPKEAPSMQMAAPAMGGGDEAPRGVRWTAPAGWTETRGGGMRLATLTPPAQGGKAEVTVVALPGESGGELANVNRWRGQIALPPIVESQLSEGRATVRSALGPVLVYDFTGTGEKKARLCAGMVSVSGTTWFFKLTGDEKAVAAAKPAFLKLLEGLKHDAP
ncbi:MAG: hypothetical protein HY079_10960 [Elusimicrobia bacterium]|nr:hypothetical protein [Elusimicrobiota bacterium]